MTEACEYTSLLDHTRQDEQVYENAGYGMYECFQILTFLLQPFSSILKKVVNYVHL